MFSMPERGPVVDVETSSAVELAVGEADRIEAALAVVDGTVRRLVAAERVDELARRRARRASRRALAVARVVAASRCGGDAA